jgi:hypothetical protein
MFNHSEVTNEEIIWESPQYKLRILEVRMFITLEILTYRIDRFLEGKWQRVNSRTTLREAQWFVEYIFGINIEKEDECQQ